MTMRPILLRAGAVLVRFSPLPYAAVLCLFATTELVAQADDIIELTPEATAPEPYSRIRGLVELSDGRILVADQRERAVYLASFDDVPRVMLGRNGEGPGEYKAPIGLFLVGGDTAFVYDSQNGRYVEVTAEGVVGTRTFESMGLPAGRSPHDLDTRRRMYWDRTVNTRMRKREDPSANKSAVLRSDGSGGADTVAVLTIDGPSNPGPVPEWDRWDAGAEGWVAVVRTLEEYRVDWVDPDGAVIQGDVIPEERLRISRADRDSLGATPMAGAATMSGAAPRRARDQYVPERYPFAHEVQVSPDRRAWVFRSQPLDEGRPLFDVFDVTGTRVARYRLPEGRELVGFGDGVLFAVREDEVGLLWVERYRIPG